jgi:hypothetical protein
MPTVPSIFTQISLSLPTSLPDLHKHVTLLQQAINNQAARLTAVVRKKASDAGFSSAVQGSARVTSSVERAL